MLSATRRGARLARRPAVAHLTDWGRPYESAAQIVAEPAADAITHERFPGRDFRMSLTLAADGTVRIEVTDVRGERLRVAAAPAPRAESGRGLLLVAAPADRWGVTEGPVPRKTVWAELGQLAPVEPEQGCRVAVERDPVSCEVKE
ncbi:ATP-binding protein [Streptomyces sp. NPDC054847]